MRNMGENVLFRIVKHIWPKDFNGSLYELQRYSRINKAWTVCLTDQRLGIIHSYMDDHKAMVRKISAQY